MGIGETNPVPRLVVRFQGALHRRRLLLRRQLDLGPPLMVTVSKRASVVRPNLPIFKLPVCRAVRLTAEVLARPRRRVSREGRKGPPLEDRGHGRVARRGDRRAAGVREVCFE